MLRSSHFRIFTLGAALALAGCAGTPSAPVANGGTAPAAGAGLTAFAQQVSAFNANLNQNIASVASGAVQAGVALGKAACGAASEGNGLFQAAAPALTLAGVDPSVGATEAGVMIAVNLNCAIVDAANPAAPVTPQLAQAVGAVVQAVPQIQSAIKAVNPAVAATAAAPSTN